jgi:isoquinoline 1-oxidoreductase alpha subunit
MAIRFVVNGAPVAFVGDAAMPLLWYLRDHARLLGTKYGCGIGLCGACTVHVDGRARRACVLPLAELEGRAVTTIEGLAPLDSLSEVQRAWIEEDVAQCGWCQAGQIMAAADLLKRAPEPSNAEIDAISNLCRCGTYPRIRRAILRAAGRMRSERTG